MAKLTDDEQDAKAFRAIFLGGSPLVPPSITAPGEVIAMATRRLHELRTRAATTRVACEVGAGGAMKPIGGA
jgi:hypothetical protein